MSVSDKFEEERYFCVHKTFVDVYYTVNFVLVSIKYKNPH
jgi:hypothetical protein